MASRMASKYATDQHVAHSAGLLLVRSRKVIAAGERDDTRLSATRDPGQAAMRPRLSVPHRA